MIPEGYAQVTLGWRTSDAVNTAANVFGVRLDDPADDPTDVVGKVNGALVAATGIWPNICNVWSIVSEAVKFGPDDTGPSAEGSFAKPGTNTAACTTPNVAYLAKKITATGGRRGRGRLYLPGVPEAAVNTNGAVDTGFLAAMQLGLNAFLTALNASDIPMVVLHGPSSTGLPPTVAPYEVTALTLQPVAATQRRRMRR